MNHLHNAQFRPGPENSLLYFTSEENVRWQPSSSQGHHVCVMTQTSSRQITQLNYALPIWVKDRTELHLCAWLRASQRKTVSLSLRYQKQDGTSVKEEQIQLTAAPQWQWKYQCLDIPKEAEQLRLSLHLTSPGTLQLRQPRVFFWW